MLKEESVFNLLHFLRILETYWQAGVIGELMTDQSHMHKIIYGSILLSI